MRFWLIELPALMVTVAFRAYGIFLAAMTLILFGFIIKDLIAYLFAAR